MFNDEDFANATDEEAKCMAGQNAAMNDPYYRNWGDGNDHGWTESDIEQYEQWLMSNDPGIRADGSYYD